MSRVIRRYYGYTGYFQIYNMPFRYLPLFDYSEKRDIYQKGGINGGCPTIFDHLREHQIPFYLSDWRAREERNLAALKTELQAGKIRFGYPYLAAMDAVLHAHGTDSVRVAEKIRWYEEQLRAVIEVARQKYVQVRVYVFSDHGMTNTVGDVDLIGRIDALGFRLGVDFNVVYGSTMARFWFFNPRARERIVEALGGETRGRILTREDLAEYGCDFPDGYRTRVTARGGTAAPGFPGIPQIGKAAMPGIPVFGPTAEAPKTSYTLPTVAAFYPAFAQRPEALRYADVRTVPNFNEFSVWETQAPDAELFAVLLGQE